MVQVDGEKMSKSLGNFTTLAELLDAWDPRALRLLVLQTHYRRTMEIGPTTLDQAAAALARLDKFADRMAAADLPDAGTDVDVVDRFQAAGGSFVMLAKGNRSRQVTEACARHGGFYLGSIGGPAARLALDSIRSVEVLEYPELGMEAVWRIEVEDFPAFVVVDDKGGNFFDEVSTPVGLS